MGESVRGGSLDRARGRRVALRSAMAALESSIAAPAAGREAQWLERLGADLDHLAEALEAHIKSAEAPDGLLAEILHSAPRLAHRVDKVRADHVALRAAVDEARGAAAAGREPSELRDRVVEVLGHLLRHRHLGADLVYEAYMVDIEAAD
jgi:hypothetical protein